MSCPPTQGKKHLSLAVRPGLASSEIKASFRTSPGYIYTYKWAYKCLFVCLLVHGGLMEIQTPTLYKILHPHPHLSKEGFGAGLNPAPFPLGLGAWNPKSLRCSAGCKLARLAPGTSASYTYINGRTNVCLFVCWLMEIQTPTLICTKFCTPISPPV